MAFLLHSVLISAFVLSLLHSVDHSRVVLRGGDPNVVGSDYINANFVGVSYSLIFDNSSLSYFTGKLNSSTFNG